MLYHIQRGQVLLLLSRLDVRGGTGNDAELAEGWKVESGLDVSKEEVGAKSWMSINLMTGLVVLGIICEEIINHFIAL